MAGKLTGTQREEAKLFWLEHERNCVRTSKEFNVHHQTIANYRDKYQWVKWADEQDAALWQESLKLAVRGKAKILRTAYKINERIKEQVDVPGGVRTKSPGRELKSITDVVQLLSGGPTQRISLDNVIEFLRRLPDDERVKLRTLAEQMDARDGGKSDKPA